MRILIVRHADPDYTIDSLTETGWKEAKMLAVKMKWLNEQYGGFSSIYLSPLGRAQDTASCTLEAIDRQDAVTLEWLKEFPPKVRRPHRPDKDGVTWDWVPSDWTVYPDFYDKKKWNHHPAMEAAHVEEEYERVGREFFKLLAEHGYEKADESEGCVYHVTKPQNKETIVFFCHFGLECVLLSHLIGCSPMILWHNFCAAPSSVTTVYSEERREGIAAFRIQSFGDTGHLYAQGEEPSFAARFTETYDPESRLD